MDEEAKFSDLDARVRAALRSNPSATRRVLLAALTVQTVRLKADTTGASVRPKADATVASVHPKVDDTGASVVSGFSRTQRSARIARRSFMIAAAAVVVLALATAGGMWLRQPAAPVPPAMPSLKVSNQGSLLVVEGADGRRWIVGPATERRSGSHYVIVISE